MEKKVAEKTEELTRRTFQKLARQAVEEVTEYSPSFEFADQVMEDSMRWYDEMGPNLPMVVDAPELVRKVVMNIVEKYL